jgi:hypothetical protein
MHLSSAIAEMVVSYQVLKYPGSTSNNQKKSYFITTSGHSVQKMLKCVAAGRFIWKICGGYIYFVVQSLFPVVYPPFLMGLYFVLQSVGAAVQASNHLFIYKQGYYENK